MNVLRVYKIAKLLLAVTKTLVPVIKEIFGKDLDKDGTIDKVKKA